MNYKTHSLFGFFLYFLLVKFNVIPNNILYFFVIILATLLPDIDHPNSYISNKVKVTKGISRNIKHRGVTHTIEFTLTLTLIILYFSKSIILSFVFFVGYFSHILLDILTVSGVKISYFLDYHPKGFIRTNSTGELIFDIIIVLLTSYVIWSLFF